MITVGIDPVILQLGHFALRWYGTFTALGALAVVFITRRELKRKSRRSRLRSPLFTPVWAWHLE